MCSYWLVIVDSIDATICLCPFINSSPSELLFFSATLERTIKDVSDNCWWQQKATQLRQICLLKCSVLANFLSVLQKPHPQILSPSVEMVSPARASPPRPMRRTVTAAQELGSLPEVLNLQTCLTSPLSHPWPALTTQVWQNNSSSFIYVRKAVWAYYHYYLCNHCQEGITVNDHCTCSDWVYNCVWLDFFCLWLNLLPGFQETLKTQLTVTHQV